MGGVIATPKIKTPPQSSISTIKVSKSDSNSVKTELRRTDGILCLDNKSLTTEILIKISHSQTTTTKHVGMYN